MKPALSATTERAGFLFLGGCMGSNWHSVIRQAAISQVNKAAQVKRFTGLTAKWRNKCLARDNYQCLLCKSAESLQVHHIERWYDAPHKRLDVCNGATLCKKCHELHHNHKGEAFPREITVQLLTAILHSIRNEKLKKKESHAEL